MTRISLIAILAGAGLASAALAQDPAPGEESAAPGAPPAAAQPEGAEPLTRADAITAAQDRAGARAGAMFDRADSDGDGVLTADERAAVRADRRTGPPRGEHGRHGRHDCGHAPHAPRDARG